MVWPRLVLYNAAMTASGRGKQWNGAWQLLRDLQSKLQANEISLNSLATACQGWSWSKSWSTC